MKDGPAHLSGKVQPSDIVKAVDSVRVGRRHGYALDNVKKLILGLPDTTVTLRVLRSHQEFDVIITRAHPRTSSATNWLGKTKTLVAGATPFTSSPATTPNRQTIPDLPRHSTCLPVQPTGTEQDVRLSGGRYSVQLDYQVATRASRQHILRVIAQTLAVPV